MNDKSNKGHRINEIFIYIVVSVSLIIFILASFPQIGIVINQNQIFLLVIVLVFLIFKYFNVIEIPGFLKLSKEIEEVKNETKAIRDTIQTLAISQSSANSSIINQIVNQVRDDAIEVKEAGQKLPDIAPAHISQDETEYELAQIEDDIAIGRYVSAFASIRNLIESLLREILRKKGEDIGRMSWIQLEKLASRSEILSPDIINSMRAVRSAANTIIHSAPWENALPSSEVETISDIGIKTIHELMRIRNESAS